MTLALFLAIIELLKASTELARVVIASMPPETQAEEWRRHLARTEWLQKLAEAGNDQILKLIAAAQQPRTIAAPEVIE